MTSAAYALLPQTVSARIAKAVMAGRALIADPALTDQSAQGQLPSKTVHVEEADARRARTVLTAAAIAWSTFGKFAEGSISQDAQRWAAVAACQRRGRRSAGGARRSWALAWN